VELMVVVVVGRDSRIELRISWSMTMQKKETDYYYIIAKKKKKRKEKRKV
jgi:hypothetical protein